jgi:hypothetical protein
VDLFSRTAGSLCPDYWIYETEIYRELEKDHGRIERRSVTTVTSLDWLERYTSISPTP